MSNFSKNIAQDSTLQNIKESELDRLSSEYEWFTTVRVVKSYLQNRRDPRLDMLSFARGTSSFFLNDVDINALTIVTSDDVIDRFLKETNLRITLDEDGPERAVVTEAIFSDDDDVISEDLAAIYASQGLYKEAKVIYSKLSLLNPEKSVYFASLIADMENK